MFAIYALPFMGGLAAVRFAYAANAGLVLSGLAGIGAALLSVALVLAVLAIAKNPALRLIALPIFAVPVTVAGAYFECTAGAAVHSGEVGGIMALAIALRRNKRNWLETLPDDIGRRNEKSATRLAQGSFVQIAAKPAPAITRHGIERRLRLDQEVLEPRADEVEEGANALRQPGAAEIECMDFLLIALDRVCHNFDQPAGRDVGAGVIVAETREPDAGHGHAPYCLAVVGEHRAIHRSVDHAAAFPQWPDGRGPAKVESEAIVPGKIINRPGGAVTGEITWRGDDLAAGYSNPPGHHGRILKRPDAKGDISAVQIEIDDLIGQRQINDDIGVCLPEGGKQRF